MRTSVIVAGKTPDLDALIRKAARMVTKQAIEKISRIGYRVPANFRKPET